MPAFRLSSRQANKRAPDSTAGLSLDVEKSTGFPGCVADTPRPQTSGEPDPNRSTNPDRVGAAAAKAAPSRRTSLTAGTNIGVSSRPATSANRPAPPCASQTELLWRHVMPARQLRHERARRIGLRDDPPLAAPATPTSYPNPDIDAARQHRLRRMWHPES